MREVSQRSVIIILATILLYFLVAFFSESSFRISLIELGILVVGGVLVFFTERKRATR